MRAKQQATVALREVVAFTGVRADKYALHSLKIGGATHLSARGASQETLQREGRWVSDAHKAYARSHGKDASRVANYMAWVPGSSRGRVHIGSKLFPFQSWRDKNRRNYFS